jgi:hypothetical protein
MSTDQQETDQRTTTQPDTIKKIGSNFKIINCKLTL